MITVTRKIHIGQGTRSQKELRGGEGPSTRDSGRVPHVSRLFALAIRLDQLLRDGQVSDQAELARLGHVSRARLTQIMNLLLLAPDLQEQILFLPPTQRGRDAVTEGDLRRRWGGGSRGGCGVACGLTDRTQLRNSCARPTLAGELIGSLSGFPRQEQSQPLDIAFRAEYGDNCRIGDG